MAVNQLIARGIAPIGQDLPQIGNMLFQRDQARQQNALAQMATQADATRANAFAAQQQDAIAQRRREALQQTVDLVANNPAILPQFRADLKASGILPDIDDNADLPTITYRLGLGPAKVEKGDKPGTPFPGVGADGKPGLFTWGPDGKPQPTGLAPVRSGGGLRIESDGQGGFSLYQGDGASAIDLGKPAQGALQTAAIDARSALDRLGGIRAGFNPQWLTLKEQATQYMRGMQARAQGLPFVPKLSEQETASLSAFTTFKSDTLDNLNRTIKELTGAAMGVQEAERIIGTLPSLDDDPVSFKSKLDAAEQRLRMVLARSIYTQKRGIKFDAIPVEKMRVLINQRGDELFKTMKDPQKVQQTLEAEFFQ